jgi:dTDP-4-amino-4,6-dideoxygalactose transaminase
MRTGAVPVFVDVEAESFNLTPETLAPGLAAARAAGLAPRGIIAVDLFGRPADYDRIAELAAAEGLWLLSDAAQSFGARYHDRRAGGCGDFAATSFFPAKPLGCYGDGGAVFSDDEEFAQLCESIRFHGQGRDHWHNERIGMTGRLDTIQAAVLLAKLAIFEDELAARNRIAGRYRAGLGNDVVTPGVAADCESVWAQYTIRVPGGRRDAVVGALQAAEIPCAVYYRSLVSEQPAYRACPVAEGGTPAATVLTGEVLSLPIHPYLEPDDQDRVIAAVRAAL